jgi:hypothetical protein
MEYKNNNIEVSRMQKIAGISYNLNEVAEFSDSVSEDSIIRIKEGDTPEQFAMDVAKILKEKFVRPELIQKFYKYLENQIPPPKSIEGDFKQVNEEINQYCTECLKEYITEHWERLEEAEYHGRKVSLGKPFLTPDGPKKRSVYVKNAKGNVIKVNFGDPNMRIKKSSPKHRKSFRARHHCENPGPRTKANYWSCRAW